MSNSWRKPYIRDCEKGNKHIASKITRQRLKNIKDNVPPSYFKKIYDRYDIYEYNIYSPIDKNKRK